MSPRALFEAVVAQDISVSDEGGAAARWRVREVVALSPHHLRADPFVVRFEAPATARPAQGVFAAAFPDGSRVDMFAVPVAASATSITFEAIFN
jgi:hypothetical protein